MTDVASSRRPSSRQGSPVPRRQLGILPVNQRSYSRVNSKGIIGDDSPLMSPLPYYPRRRSVTFAGEQSVREERPNYNAAYSASAPVSPARDGSPPPVSILKPNSSFLVAEEEDSGAAPACQAAAATVSDVVGRKYLVRNSPVPARGRSNSRQRLAARRKEAQLHRSFYDDSFVEEYVLRAKTELEEEEAEQRRMQEQLRAEQERTRRAERRVSEATEKINALQHAKKVLLASTVRRHPSVTPSPPRAPAEKSKRHSSLLRELEEDPDPEVQAALKELEQSTVARQQSRVHSSTNQRRRSISIVSADDLAEIGEVDYSDGNATRKRARLEKIVSTLLANKAKSKSKCSVMVIDWSDIDSGADGDAPRPDEDREETAVNLKRQRGRPAKSRSLALGAEGTLVSTAKALQKVPTKRAASSRKRLVSAEPELGDSLLFEDEAEQPILLPRRQHTLPAPTRSLSHIDTEGDDDTVRDAYSVERLVRQPPRATRAPAPRQHRARFASAHTRRGAEDVSTLTAGPASRARAPQPPVATAGEPNGAPPRRRRGSALRADPNDPMAVFFEAAFPSPSKFDEMMMQAGGLPETRRGGGGGRGQGRQPNLVLPSSIGRRR